MSKLLSHIFNLDLSLDYDYEFINLLNSVPNNFSLLFMKLLDEKKVDKDDLKIIMRNIRDLVYQRQEFNIDLRQKIIDKIQGKEVNEIYSTSNFDLERNIIYNILRDSGIFLDESDKELIFIDEYNRKLITTNYFNIPVEYAELYIDTSIALKPMQIKKNKQINAYLRFKKDYQGG